MDDSERPALRAGPLAPGKKRQSHSSAGPWPGWKSCFLGGVTYLFWETRDAGLPHHWPLSSSKSSPHPPGSRGQAERQLATDTALQRTKTGEGLREEAEEGRDSCRRIKEQNKRAAAERGRGCLLGTPQHHPVPPAHRSVESHSLRLCVCLPCCLGTISAKSLTRALGHPFEHISHGRTKTFFFFAF